MSESQHGINKEVIHLKRFSESVKYDCKKAKGSLVSSVGSKDPHFQDFFYHNDFLEYPVEFPSIGIFMARTDWANILLAPKKNTTALLEDFVMNSPNNTSDDAVRKTFFVQNAKTWLDSRGTEQTNFNPWSFQCKWDDDQERIIRNLIPIDEQEYIHRFSASYPEIGLIRQKRRNGEDWAIIRETCDNADIPQIAETAPIVSSLKKRKIRFFCYVEEMKEENEGVVDFDSLLRVLASLIEHHGRNKQNMPIEIVRDIYVFGVPFSRQRCQGALESESIEEMSAKLFKKWLRSRYLYYDIDFIDFEHVCPVVKLAVLYFSKFLWTEKQKPRHVWNIQFDANKPICNVLPTQDECAKMIDSINTESIKKQLEHKLFVSTPQNPSEFFQFPLFADIATNLASSSTVVNDTFIPLQQEQLENGVHNVTSTRKVQNYTFPIPSSSWASQAQPQQENQQDILQENSISFYANAIPEGNVQLDVDDAGHEIANGLIEITQNPQPLTSDTKRPTIGGQPISDAVWAEVVAEYRSKNARGQLKAKAATYLLFKKVLTMEERIGTRTAYRSPVVEDKMDDVRNAVEYMIKTEIGEDMCGSEVIKAIKAAISEKGYYYRRK